VGQGHLITRAVPSHSDARYSVGFLWTSDQPDAETSTRQQTILERDRTACPLAELEPTISVSERPQIHALDRSAIDSAINAVYWQEMLLKWSCNDTYRWITNHSLIRVYYFSYWSRYSEYFTGWTVQSSNPGRSKAISVSSNISRTSLWPAVSYPVVKEVLSRVVTLATNFKLMSTLRMSGAVGLIPPPHAFKITVLAAALRPFKIFRAASSVNSLP
jgi:hypothetical protein